MRNLVNLYSKASPDNIQAGLIWYQDAHNYCKLLGETYSIDLAKVCGVMSALSPGTNYEQNKKDCLNLIKGTKMYKCTTYGSNVRKARSILRGDILPDKAFNLLTGAKTFNFYHNILNPTSPDYVTIDRHAYNAVCSDDYRGLTKNQYLKVASHYINASLKIGILPCQLQAIVWLDYRERQNIFFKKFDIVDCPF